MITSDFQISLTRFEPFHYIGAQAFQTGALSCLDRTLPDDEHTPSIREKEITVPSVAFPIGFEFVAPELLTGGGLRRKLASLVNMPKTTMNKDHGVERGKTKSGDPGSFPSCSR